MAAVSLREFLSRPSRPPSLSAPTVSAPSSGSRTVPLSQFLFGARRPASSAIATLRPRTLARSPQPQPRLEVPRGTPPDPHAPLGPASGLRDLSLALGAAGTVTGLARTGTSIADFVRKAPHRGQAPGLGLNFPTVAGGLQTASGVADLAQGRTVRGALSTAGGLLSLGETAGVVPSEVAGPASAALGLGTGIHDLVSGGSGQDLAFAIASLANPAFGVIMPAIGLGKIATDALTGQGVFGPTPLPFAERGRGFSAADNAASQISKMRGIEGAKALQTFIQGSTSPGDLLRLAALGRDPSDLYNTRLAPHGEIQFSHPDYPDPAQFQAALQQIVRTEDPALLRRFIGGVQIQTGETGATVPNFALTDWYRRQLVSQLPQQSPLRQDMAGLFEPIPRAYLEPLERLAGVNPAMFALGGGLGFGLSPEDLTGEWGSPYAAPQLSMFGRTPEEARALTALHEKSTAVRMHPDLAQWVDRQLYPGYYGGVDQLPTPWPSQQVGFGAGAEPEPNTPEWFARYASLQSGGYVQAPPGTPVPATIHGGEYVVPAGPLAERLRQRTLAPFVRQPGLTTGGRSVWDLPASIAPALAPTEPASGLPEWYARYL